MVQEICASRKSEEKLMTLGNFLDDLIFLFEAAAEYWKNTEEDRINKENVRKNKEIKK